MSLKTSILESSEWRATVQVGPALFTVEVPRSSRPAARRSHDLRPFVRVEPLSGPSPTAVRQQACDVGLAAMLGQQQRSSR